MCAHGVRGVHQAKGNGIFIEIYFAHNRWAFRSVPFELRRCCCCCCCTASNNTIYIKARHLPKITPGLAASQPRSFCPQRTTLAPGVCRTVRRHTMLPRKSQFIFAFVRQRVRSGACAMCAACTLLFACNCTVMITFCARARAPVTRFACDGADGARLFGRALNYARRVCKLWSTVELHYITEPALKWNGIARGVGGVVSRVRRAKHRVIPSPVPPPPPPSVSHR